MIFVKLSSGSSKGVCALNFYALGSLKAHKKIIKIQEKPSQHNVRKNIFYKKIKKRSIKTA